MSWQLGVLAAYSIGLVLLGLAIGRKVRSAGSFFVADRQLGPVLIFATILAANIGAGSTVGAASLGYRDGIAAWWWVGSAGLGTLLLAVWLGPRMWREARRHDLRTVGDFLELRYGRSVRGTVAALLWVGTLAILAGQLIAMAWVLEVVAGIPKPVGCLLGGVAMTLYFTAGGLLTSAWVNLVELVVLLAGFALALPLALDRVGGLEGLRTALPEEELWRFGHNGGSGWLLAAMLVPAFLVSPGLLQKVFGARDERAVRWGVGLSGVVLMGFAAVPPLLGMIARALHPDLASPDQALPTLLVSDLPAVIGLLGLAAVFSAELSTADAILFMLSTSLSQDLYRRFVKPQASDAEVLRVARLAAVAGGLAGVGLALLLPTVIGSLSIFYSLLSVSLFVPLVAGLESRRAGLPEAFAAIGAGVAAMVALHLAGGVAGLGPGGSTFVALVLSAVAFLAVLGARSGRARGRPSPPKTRPEIR